ncbi:MAG: hypothetical protein LBC47_02790, partial [Tannerella sp.]|nr:hypothetical protein [Tannerella sp.]
MTPVEERIQAVADKWFIREPLLFMTLMSHQITPNKGLRHIMRCGQGRIEYCCDNKIEQLTDKQFEENLRAEVIRILLRHPYRRYSGKKYTAYLASNVTLNEYYSFEYLKYKVRDFWRGKGGYNKQTFEFYYNEILKLPGAPGGSGITNNQDEDEQAALWNEDDFMDTKIKELIEWAQTNMQWGSMPGAMVEMLAASLKIEIDYRKILNGFRATILSSDRTLTRFKPSRRYGFQYMGKKNRFITNLLIGVDVSGSISDDEVKRFYSTVNRFFRYGIHSIDVLQFDADIKGKPFTMKKAQKTIHIK